MLYQGELIDYEAYKPDAIPLRRRSDDTLYAFRCPSCGGCWKIYQNACGCKRGNEGERK